jgi:glutamate-ammonia-ligase adenylyltransferase
MPDQPPSVFSSFGPLAPIFDPARAARTLDDLAAKQARFLDDPAFKALIESAAGNSPYLARLMLRDPATLARLHTHGPDALIASAHNAARGLAAGSDIAGAMRVLRESKRRVALAVALADIGGLYSLEQVTVALSNFADAAVQGSVRFLLAREAAKTGMAGSPEELESSTGLIVLAMGKHGACELNYSSDIDLVVFYEAEKFPFLQRGDKGMAAVTLVKDMIKLLSDTTADGYVFRTDLRLRPDAGATQVAITAAAAELYYESTGQNWERAAMIKARACAGDREAATQFLKNLAPFLWRKNLDFAAIEDIHSIKRQIQAHGGHGRIAVRGHNIKLGRGGIREIEFFVQTQQLILGGRDPGLRERTTLGALKIFEARGLITPEVRADLDAAYRFLRLTEHRLQMIDDQQTHTLPTTDEGLDHVARFCGFAETNAFEETLRGHLGRVQEHYAHLFEREAPLSAQAGNLVFTGVDNDPGTLTTLSRMGFQRAADITGVIRGWHHGRIRATRSARARELLTKLIPALLDALAATADPDAAFFQFDRFLSGLPAGVQLFSMLLANPRLLGLLSEIAGSAPRLSSYLGRNPGVLDALLDPGFLEALPDRAALAAGLEELLSRFPGYEGALDACRRFAKEENFRIGVQLIEGLAVVEEAGSAYADVAECVIASLLGEAAAELARVHGRVKGGAFVVVAQGKLGGREMTASSDLDLVFVYDFDAQAEASDGPKPPAVSLYFARLAQRFVGALTAQTAEGPLYEVDMRLRPSGSQGPVAVRLETFATYHRGEAWTWERMALTRARVIAGTPDLRARVEAEIRAGLTAPQDRTAILSDAKAMRLKLAEQFPGRDPWDIKCAQGGLVDIEFIAQALQLVHAQNNPDVRDTNTALALTKLHAVGVLPDAQAKALHTALRLQQALMQVLSIATEGDFRAAEAPPGLLALLARAAGTARFEEAEAALLEHQRTARRIFDAIFS